MFDNEVLLEEVPRVRSGHEVLRDMNEIENKFGKELDENVKTSGKRKRKLYKKKDPEEQHLLYRKKSIFFDLPYWAVSHFNTIPFESCYIICILKRCQLTTIYLI